MATSNAISAQRPDPVPVGTLLDLDDIALDEIDVWLAFARSLADGRRDVSRALEGRVLCPLFGQESSRTFVNSTSAFLRMGGTVLPLALSGTRFGSRWKEPVQDFAVLLDACCDHVVCRDGDMQTIRDLAAALSIPFVNAGNGTGTGAEHPLQALVDLYTIREVFGERKLHILMMGGTHIRTTRSQIKLFLREGHALTIMAPPPRTPNADIETLITEQCAIRSPSDPTPWNAFDLIYHNGIDEDADTESPHAYCLDIETVRTRCFEGAIMHSLPRKNELSPCLDPTPYNLYFRQMMLARWVFQSIFYHQNIASRMHAHAK